MTTAPLASLASVLRRQEGVFSTPQAVAVGIHPSTLRRLEARGSIEKLAHGVHRVTAVPDRWEGRAIAALLSGGDDVCLGSPTRWHGSAT